MPNLFLMAGPNGAGKSTTAKLVLTGKRSVEEFVNADVVQAERRVSEIEAGRIVLRRLDELTAGERDMAFETTLSSAGLESRIAAMREAGYLFHLVYVWLPSADMAVQRVAARVRNGGHSIPEDVIRRRYDRSLNNFFDHYMPIADSWMMIDNSARPLRWIAAREVGGTICVHDDPLWKELRTRHMRPPTAAKEEKAVSRPAFTTEDMFRAADEAVRQALKRHKELGQSVVVWRDGQIVTLKPEEIDI
jgi:predicted ABC-type ATPase